MDLKLNCLVLLIFAFAVTIDGTPSDEFVKKYISLDSVTPQAILHLPPSSHGLDDTQKLCDFWVSFFSDLSDEALPHHKAFGISIVPTNLDLAAEDYIEFIAHPMYHDGDNSTKHGEQMYWDSYNNLASENLEFKPSLAWQDVCINIRGNWTEHGSTATLVITLFVDRTEAGYGAGECPKGMTVCGCQEEENRCIYSDLVCNGVTNCGSVCGHDESQCGAGVEQFVKKYISLDAMTPQAIIHLPPLSHELNDASKLCDFWVSFFNDLSQTALPHHKGFGISIVPTHLQLAAGDSIDFLAHPMYYEDGASHQLHGERTSWGSSENLQLGNLEFKPIMGWQDVCFNMTGKWLETGSTATLVATLIFDRSEASYTAEECPTGMTACGCAQEQNRCIYSDLVCNGVSNCGAVCKHDESTCSLGEDGKHSDQFVKKYITLDSITPQAILHLPPVSHGLDDSEKLCDFWVSFFNDLSQSALPHHKAFGISIVPSHFELEAGDSIDFTAHPMYYDESNSHHHGEKESWDSSKNLASANLEFKPSLGWQDVCINLKGRWNSGGSNATLVITLFVDRTEAGYAAGECPTGMSVCGCAQEQNRCIYSDLVCNGVTNCGAVCGHDESTCSLGQDGKHSDQFVKKYISLDAITPQAVLHLPPVSHALDNSTKLCDFWVSFFNDLSQAALPHHKAFGISIVPSQLELADGDTIEFMGHPMYFEEGSSHQLHGERASWGSSHNFAHGNLEFKPSLGWQDVCINMKGSWNEKKSKASLVITLYFDRDEADYLNGECPNGMTVCGCPQEQHRCIYSHLLCNGAANCGAVCKHDENTCSVAGIGNDTANRSSEWTSFEYMIMTCITGLLLILIAGIFVLTMVYHRRTMALTRAAVYEGNTERQYPHVINSKC